MFLVNSRYPHFCATLSELPRKRSPFSLSYRSILPSSFNIVLSSALVSSTHPPVSVSGTVLNVGGLSWNSFKALPIQSGSTSTRIRPYPTGSGILTGLPSTTTLVLALGSDSPYADEHGVGTLGFSATVIFTPFIVTHVSILTSYISTASHKHRFVDLKNAPLPLAKNSPTHRFGG